METEQLSVMDIKKDVVNIEKAAYEIQKGNLVVFPTETVYGLGANALDSSAVEKIFTAKGRPQDNPLIVHVAEVDQIMPLVNSFPEMAKKLADAFWPGPLTMIFPKSTAVPNAVSAGLDSVAIRIPSHPVARALIQAAGVPIAAPSANLSGSPSPTTAKHSYDDLQGRVSIVLDGGSCVVGLESTVITFVNDVPIILRPGFVTLEDIRRVVGAGELDEYVLNESWTTGKVLSPGQKYKHYSPKAKVILVNGSTEEYAIYCNSYQGKDVWAMAFTEDLPLLTIPSASYGSITDEKEQAERLFASLRFMDEQGVGTALIHAPHPSGIGVAIYNRLLRASSLNLVVL